MFALAASLVAACRHGFAVEPSRVTPGASGYRMIASQSDAADAQDSLDGEGGAAVAAVDAAPSIPAFLAGFGPGATNELTRTESTEDGRTTTNVEATFAVERPTEIVDYVAPNGNTIEQTLGRKRAEGESFRYDIQHALAQIRLYRSLVPERNVVLVVLEGPDLSWPTWVARHADAPARARALLLGQATFARAPRFAWISHSGGGSLVLAAVDGARSIPAEVDKIVFLDSDYAFAAKSGHGQKLATWLREAPSHRLVALAYDDRKIRLHGRRVVASGGGSFRATQRMTASLETEKVRFVRDTIGPFDRARGLDGRVDLRVHPNRENRILHSALVSDENGIAFSLGLGHGSTVEARARFGRPRAFEAYVDPAPEPQVLADGGTVPADAATD